MREDVKEYVFNKLSELDSLQLALKEQGYNCFTVLAELVSSYYLKLRAADFAHEDAITFCSRLNVFDLLPDSSNRCNCNKDKKGDENE